MLTPELFKPHFERALPYDEYVSSGTPDQQPSWKKFHGKVALTDSQRAVLSTFSRRVNVLVISGTWCGDCVQQVPMFDHIARAARNAVALRLVDRDEHADLAAHVTICGGRRVPTVIFLNEDFELIGLAGDSTLSRFRAKAAKSLGASCPMPGAEVPADEVAANLQDWVNEFEKAHLLVRLSAKLRQRHGD